MQIHADVGCRGIEARRRDAGNCPARGQSGQMSRDIGPVYRRILCVPELTVIGSGPDESLLNLGRGDCKYHLTIELTDVVADDSPRWDDMRRILCGQVRADARPGLTRVGGPENHLATVVHRIVIEGIDCERRSPMAAIFEIVRRRVEGVLPRTDGVRLFISGVPPRHRVAVAGGPHDLWVTDIGNREARFAPPHVAVPAAFPRIQTP